MPKKHLISLWILGICCFCGSARAQDEQYRFTLDFGYRWQPGFQGSEDLYRSQLDYGEGPKLFSGGLFISSPPGSNPWLDRLELRMNSWGGEPYSMAQVRAGKSDLYDLRFDYQNAVYFNALPFFANPLFAGGNLETQHKFDVSQRATRFELTLKPRSRISPFVALDHSDRGGVARTTLSTGADEFLLGSNVDTHSNDLRLGVTLTFSQLSLVLEQGFRWYRDDTVFSSTGPQSGNVTRPFLGRNVTLDGYRGENDFDVTIPFSNALAVYRPSESLVLRGKLSYSIADLDPRFLDEFSGNLYSPAQTAFFGTGRDQIMGRAKQPNLVGDFSAEWQPLDRLRILERFNARRFHVSGSALAGSTFLNVDPVLGQGIIDRIESSTLTGTFLSMDLDTQEVQAAFSLTPRTVLRLGHRYEQKEVQLGELFSWDRNVLISGFSHRSPSRYRLALDYELGRTERPIFRLDPVDFQKLRIRGSYTPFSNLEFTGNLSVFDHDDDLEGIDYSSESRDYALQFTYTPTPRITVVGEYERSSIDTDLLFIVPQTLTSSRSLYREQGNYGQLLFSLRLPREVDLSLGYSVWGTTGNFPLTYHQPVLKIEVPLRERLWGYLQWNYYGYHEKLQLFPQDYTTHLLILGFRVSLDHE